MPSRNLKVMEKEQIPSVEVRAGFRSISKVSKLQILIKSLGIIDAIVALEKNIPGASANLGSEQSGDKGKRGEVD